VFGSLLNARRRFFAAAWSPVLANIAIICSLLAVPSVLDGSAPTLQSILDDPALRWLLGLGATGGIALQALVLVPAVHRAGIRMRFRVDLRHPAVRRLIALSGWTLGYVAANQVAVIVIQNLALGLGVGQQDAYTKAAIFFYFPHGLLAMSIATTFIPEMARSVAAKDRQGFIDRTSTGVRLVALVSFPAAFGFLVLRRPIVGALLERGEFTSAAADTTARALAGFSLGLIGYSVYLFVLRGFYAHQDTKTPFIVNLVQNVLNIVLAVALLGRYGVLGLGLAFALSYLFAAVLALAVLRNKVRGFPLRPVYLSFARMLLASVVMAEIVWLVARMVGGNSGGPALLRTVVGTIVGAVTYVGLMVLLRAPEIDQLRSRLRRRAPAPAQ
jgi:putative peptidoglycan lipid II flippase